jgi:hypothetical protein
MNPKLKGLTSVQRFPAKIKILKNSLPNLITFPPTQWISTKGMIVYMNPKLKGLTPVQGIPAKIKIFADPCPNLNLPISLPKWQKGSPIKIRCSAANPTTFLPYFLSRILLTKITKLKNSLPNLITFPPTQGISTKEMMVLTNPNPDLVTNPKKSGILKDTSGIRHPNSHLKKKIPNPNLNPNLNLNLKGSNTYDRRTNHRTK